jgi:nicotinamidase/pyrazinamidase
MTGQGTLDASDDERRSEPAVAIYDPRSALLIVDLQNDFADPAGSLYVRGGEDVVEVANAEHEKARSAGATVVYTQDWHPEHTPHFAQDGGTWPVHCVHDTWGAAFHPDLIVDGVVIKKGADGKDGYSAFSVRDPETGAREGTELERWLREWEIERLVITGLATDYCVVETVSDARTLGFEVDVLAEGIRAVELTPGDGERAIRRMRDAGAELV